MPRSTLVCALIGALALHGCRGPNAGRQLAALAGGGMVVGGTLALSTLPGVEKCPPDDFCFDLGIDETLRAAQIGLAVTMLLAGAGLLITAAVVKPNEPRSPDPGACIEWQRALAAERDPQRRRAARLSRPAHCAFTR